MNGMSPGQARVLNMLIGKIAELLIESGLLTDNDESELIKEYLTNVEVDDLDEEYLDQLTQDLFDAHIRERVLAWHQKEND